MIGSARSTPRLVASVGVALAVFAGMSGCLTAPAYVMTAGLTAAEGGAAMWISGELVGSFNEMYPDMVWACERMAKRLDLKFRVRRLDPTTYFLYLQDDNGVSLDLRVNRRTSRLCQITVRVGVWGNKPLSTLVLNTIEYELEARHKGEAEDQNDATLPESSPELPDPIKSPADDW